jgi:histidine triad (HIT) family protein
MAGECIFCRIVAGEVASDIVYQDEDFMGFRDAMPVAPVHVLIIPRTHITSVNELTDDRRDVAGGLIMVARTVAEKERIAERGYRLIINCGPEGGQVVPHLHLHLIGGRRLGSRLG